MQDKKNRKIKWMGAHSYLASLPLPEDSGLRVPFGLTREGGGAALRHNLVPGAHYKLGSSWTGRGRTPAVSGVVERTEAEIEKHDDVEGISGRDRYTPPRSRPGWECLWRASMQQYIQTYIYIFVFLTQSLALNSSSATEEEHRRATSPR